MARLSRKLRREMYREAVRRTSGKYRTTQDAIENAIADPNEGSVMSWGFCRVFDFEKRAFTHTDMPGSIRVNRVLGKTQVIRTDVTDRLQRSQETAKRYRLMNHGD